MKMITIKKCEECPHKDHTGSYAKDGAKPCCNHPKTVEIKGYDCFKRVIPYRDDAQGYRETKGIPDWCPLVETTSVN